MRYLFGILAVILALWALKFSWLISVDPKQKPKLIAHRGVHQVFTGKDRSAEAGGAGDIVKIDHSYIENTLPSIRAAFAYGADVVEIDVHRTTDNIFVVFMIGRLTVKRMERD